MSDGWQQRETAPIWPEWVFVRIKGLKYPHVGRRHLMIRNEFELSGYGCEDADIKVEAWAPIPEWMLK